MNEHIIKFPSGYTVRGHFLPLPSGRMSLVIQQTPFNPEPGTTITAEDKTYEIVSLSYGTRARQSLIVHETGRMTR